MSAANPARWFTILGDTAGMVLAVWAIPLAIVAVGLPFALLFMGARVVARMIWP